MALKQSTPLKRFLPTDAEMKRVRGKILETDCFIPAGREVEILNSEPLVIDGRTYLHCRALVNGQSHEGYIWDLYFPRIAPVAESA